MLLIFRLHRRRLATVILLGVSLLFLSWTQVRAQAVATINPEGGHSALREPSPPAGSAPEKKAESTEEKLSALEQMLREQGQRLNQLQQTIAEQQETIQLLANKLNAADRRKETPGSTGATDSTDSAKIAATIGSQAAAAPAPKPTVEDRLKKLEAIKLEGDLRVRSESFFGLTNNLPGGDNPAVLGNDLSSRHRMRLRARLKMSGSFGAESAWCKEFKCKEFEWSLRLATGSFADNISTNQTLTDFFNRKPFALDQAYISYRPKKFGGHLQLQGGKFESPWLLKYDQPWSNPEIMIDNDLTVDGFTESYTHTSRTSLLRELKLVAWQLPMLERNSAFVRNPNGTINLDQSRRDGRDLALYGGQVRARFEPGEASCKEDVRSKYVDEHPGKDQATPDNDDALWERQQKACPAKLAFHLSLADLYFSGTQFISPVQVFGSQLLVPVVFTIPPSGGTPAQVITTQVAIPRDLLVAGNGNLGLTTASNNAINRDGRLSSGYNLVNLLARLDLKYSERWPVSLVFNYVTNTQAHGVVTAGPGGADLILPNHENDGYWAEVQVGKAKQRGDLAFAYTFMQIEKDAVLTPFNFSDITQQSDIRAHRFQFGYTALALEKDPRVLFAVTAIVTERLNGLFGPFVATPPGSLNRPTTRLQFDTILRF